MPYSNHYKVWRHPLQNVIDGLMRTGCDEGALMPEAAVTRDFRDRTGLASAGRA